MIQGDGWCLVENPKCATNAMRAALKGFLCDPEKHATATSRNTAGKQLRAVCVRNPFDRIVSGWAYNTRGETPFFEWLTDPSPWECGVGLDFRRVPQTAWAWRCNHIMRYERLDGDWKRFCGAIGRKTVPLGVENASHRPHYRDVIDPRSRAIIEDRFAPDIATFGYEW